MRGGDIMGMHSDEVRIETQLEVQTLLDRLEYAIATGSTRIALVKDRRVDSERDKKFTNRYTMAKLFPDEDETEVLKRELRKLSVCDYIKTVKDVRYPNRSEMVIFGKQYSGDDVYIKIRVELTNTVHSSSGSHVLVMSFHFAETSFSDSDFPYKI